jgi:tetratricopeptide (TPR) repeat protein
MQCSEHPSSDVIGYCSVCGDLGCEECIKEHEGQLYCKTHFKPFQEALEKKQKHAAQLARPERQRLVVRMLDGEVLYGVCFALNVRSEGFHLDLVDKKGQPQGKTRRVAFKDLKAVYYVKSFDGNFDHSIPNRDPHSVGAEVVVEFNDGEVLRGNTFSTYREDHPRFYVIPEDERSNNISVLVERSSVKGIYDRAEYREQKHHDLEEYIKEHQNGDLNREECIGDFYFQQHDYQRALKHYRAQVRESGESPRVRKKMLSTQYNIGINHIKAHHYERALEYMEAILAADPDNAKANQKVVKLRSALERRRKHKLEHSRRG